MRKPGEIMQVINYFSYEIARLSVLLQAKGSSPCPAPPAHTLRPPPHQRAEQLGLGKVKEPRCRVHLPLCFPQDKATLPRGDGGVGRGRGRGDGGGDRGPVAGQGAGLVATVPAAQASAACS